MISIEGKALREFKFIDLFAGIGGFHYALNSFGAKCVFASEWDSFAAETYSQNFNIIPQGDITKINEEEILSSNDDYNIDLEDESQIENYLEYVIAEYIGMNWKPCLLTEEICEIIQKFSDLKKHPRDAAIALVNMGF